MHILVNDHDRAISRIESGLQKVSLKSSDLCVIHVYVIFVCCGFVDVILRAREQDKERLKQMCDYILILRENRLYPSKL